MQMHNPPHPGRILKEALENVPTTVTDFAAISASPEWPSLVC
jgi:plasmid maintenance system antidote protein VapI